MSLQPFTPQTQGIPLPAGTAEVGDGPVVTQVTPLELDWEAGGAGGGVTQVTAGDDSITIGGTAEEPTVETGTLDVIATLHPPAGSWSNNDQKITAVASGEAAGEAVQYGQLGSAAFQDTGAFDAAGDATAAQAAAEGASVPRAGGIALTGQLSPAVVTLSESGGDVALDAADGNVFRLVLTASGWTLSNPTGYTDGQPIRVRLIQDGTGGRTLSYGSAWDFGAAGAPTLSTAANASDYLIGEWSDDANAGAGAVVVSAALGF
jgi:hypothetical protein